MAAVILLVVLVAIFIGSFLLNKKTPKPEGCENLESSCGGCNIISCQHHPAYNNKEKKQ